MKGRKPDKGKTSLRELNGEGAALTLLSEIQRAVPERSKTLRKCTTVILGHSGVILHTFSIILTGQHHTRLSGQKCCTVFSAAARTAPYLRH